MANYESLLSTRPRTGTKAKDRGKNCAHKTKDFQNVLKDRSRPNITALKYTASWTRSSIGHECVHACGWLQRVYGCWTPRNNTIVQSWLYHSWACLVSRPLTQESSIRNHSHAHNTRGVNLFPDVEIVQLLSFSFMHPPLPSPNTPLATIWGGGG